MSTNSPSKIGAFVNIPDTSDAKRVAAVIKDIDSSLMMIQSKKDYIKEAKKALKEDYELTPKSIQLMIQLYHKQTADNHFEEQDELHELYSVLFPEVNAGGADDE